MIGLKVSSGASSVADETRLGELKVRKGGDSNASVVHQFILMGTPEEAIFVDPSDKGEIQLCVDTLLLLCFSDLQLLFIDKCR